MYAAILRSPVVFSHANDVRHEHSARLGGLALPARLD